MFLWLGGGLSCDFGVWDFGVTAGEGALLFCCGVLCCGVFSPVMSMYRSWNRLGHPSSS